MSKTTATPIFQFGIEITRPFSSAMYAHNDKVSNAMKISIKNAATEIWNKRAYNNWELEEWEAIKEDTFETFTIDKFQRTICHYGIGAGFTALDVFYEIHKAVEHAENWAIHEMYQELYDLGAVPKLTEGMVGFYKKGRESKTPYWNDNGLAKSINN